MAQLFRIFTALVGNNDASSHIAASSRYTPIAPENGSIHGSHPQNGTLEDNNTLRSLGDDAWKTRPLRKGGLSDLEGYISIQLYFYVVNHNYIIIR
jgi:hypothetical protein